MKAISKKTIHFPGLNWGITANVPTDLPTDPDARSAILKHRFIKEHKAKATN